VFGVSTHAVDEKEGFVGAIVGLLVGLLVGAMVGYLVTLAMQFPALSQVPSEHWVPCTMLPI